MSADTRDEELVCGDLNVSSQSRYWEGQDASTGAAEDGLCALDEGMCECLGVAAAVTSGGEKELYAYDGDLPTGLKAAKELSGKKGLIFGYNMSTVLFYSLLQ